MEVEDEIKLTDISEVLIEHLDKWMDELQYYQFIIIFVHNGNKVETGISLVDDLVFFIVDEIAHFWFTSYH